LKEEEEGKGGPPRGSRLRTRARDAAEAPPASHSVQEVPADERSAATPLGVRVVGGEGGGWFWNGIKGVGEGTVFKGCLKKSTFYYASKREKTNVVENSRKQKRVRAAA